MRPLAQKVSLLSILSGLAISVSVNIFIARTGQAQQCKSLRGNLEVIPGDLAHLESTMIGQVKLLSGASSNSNTVYSGVSGEVVLIRTESVAYDTCHRWLYVETQDSGTTGWVRADKIRTSKLNVRPACEDVQFSRGDLAQLYSYATPQQPVKLRPGAGFNSQALYSGRSGEIVSILNTAVHKNTCYQWLYVEVQNSGTTGWIRADKVRKSLAAVD